MLSLPKEEEGEDFMLADEEEQREDVDPRF